jgi:hypothetical protein
MVLLEEMPVEEILTNPNKVHLWVMLALLNWLTTIDDPKRKNKRNIQDQKRPIQAMPADCKANYPQTKQGEKLRKRFDPIFLKANNELDDEILVLD